MNVIFRTDASLKIGSGHVMRCLTLADVLHAQGAECHFVCREHRGHLCDVIEARGFSVHRLPQRDNDLEPDTSSRLVHAPWLGASWEQDAASCHHVLTNLTPDWLVVDHYALDSRWEKAVRDNLPGPVPLLLVIDDLADRQHAADLLLDQNLGRESQDYSSMVPEHCRVLAGPCYALLRPEFARWREMSLARRTSEPQVKRLLISLGGVDKENITGQVLDALQSCDLPPELEITVVMGATAPWRQSVVAQAKQMPWLTEVVVNVDDMARRMAAADLAIGAAGSTSWERCCLGLPTLMLILAENQREIALQLERSGASATLDTEDLAHSLASQLAACISPPVLTRMSERAASLVDGRGVSRLLTAMRNIGKVTTP
ncbi:UDP-2,4-diacetamido-2,4,6-trideoxy-beta-L-altropyranose hydrolase [Billgrantia antri]|uniref:UDP-2,4-diacetamido-2,4, 6-trideoxy-beta-L-altropyranose hydrolase n=1 Tax=Billgrantia antri TaxID=2846777 RepID=A0ABS6ZPK5_9GAMM|nr:UDP-2,4-diacetamido-2,4,6-trideoxy-beta-L-altropyranose hydrolase [Halomonas antri]MBW6392006.1 UDP-2,4-diacetamido-2,4,6-trideoxy-beta-L-altropyranose hydrolase [Halomonas antri]